MTHRPAAPNRPLDLEELSRPPYSETLRELDRLVSRDPLSYLHPSKRWEYPWAVERAGLRAGHRVLDAGCGDSIFPVYLARRGCEVTALDRVAPAPLDREHGVRIGYLGADLTALPLDGERFDRVFCISVIEHLTPERASAALTEFCRVLRPGGRLLLTTDYYADARAPLEYRGPGRSFPVDWSVFDEERLKRVLLSREDLELSGELDLEVDWETTRPRMVRFHGYPYTSVGLCFVKK